MRGLFIEIGVHVSKCLILHDEDKKCKPNSIVIMVHGLNLHWLLLASTQHCAHLMLGMQLCLQQHDKKGVVNQFDTNVLIKENFLIL